MIVNLPGLRASHFATALAAFGLYEVFKGCKIKFVKNYGGWQTAIAHPEISSIDDVVNKLSDAKTWSELSLWPEYDFCVEKVKEVIKPIPGKDIPLKSHGAALREDPYFALSVGTNQKIKKVKPPLENKTKVNKKPSKVKSYDEVVETSPFYCIEKSASFKVAVDKFIELARNKENTKSKLLSDTLLLDDDCPNFGLFNLDYPSGNTFDNSIAKKITKGIGVICLLALACYRMLPCYLDSHNKVTTPGWNSNKFIYPVFTKWHNRSDFISLMSNDILFKKFNQFKKFYVNLGIEAVFSVRFVKFNDKGKFFSCPEIFKGGQ